MAVQENFRPQPIESDGLAGFERYLSKNCVEYMLFIVNHEDDSPKKLTSLEVLRKAALQLADQLTGNYIWHREAFNVEIKSQKGLLFLHGTTDYGDSVEDEWLIVYLLRELSRAFTTAWIRVFDSDGEFLLVEAAKVVPKWLNPEIDLNRVWIHQGNLRIMPLSPQQEAKSKSIDLPGALQVIRAAPDSLLDSPFIEAEAFYRLEKYPGQIENSNHHAMATIPRKLAYILHDRPKAIAPAVEAFYLRDQTSMKPLLSPWPTLEFPPVDLVTVSVRFTKTLFAQVKSQRFRPPPIWATLLESAETEAQTAAEAQDMFSMLEIGMKITTGFEMMAAHAEKSNSWVVREVGLVLEDLKEDGDQVLPTDNEIQGWEDVNKADDESWLDINYEDFERELDGQSGRPRAAATKHGFGDATAQTDLRKMIARFEAFLNDEDAGIEGAELDEMDEGDDETGSAAEEGSEDEDKEVSFDDQEFSRLMRR